MKRTSGPAKNSWYSSAMGKLQNQICTQRAKASRQLLK